MGVRFLRNLPCLQVHSDALGSVASASTSIDNGFEYHYDAVAQALPTTRRRERMLSR